jgi:hypothetical protein
MVYGLENPLSPYRGGVHFVSGRGKLPIRVLSRFPGRKEEGLIIRWPIQKVVPEG